MTKKGGTFHGWTIEHGQRPDGKPSLTLTKPDRNTIVTVGRVGMDADVMLQRATVYALEQDVEQATGDERQSAQDRLHAAIVERDVARAMRVAERAVREAADAARKAE